MRIISGNLKGKKISLPINKKTRPLRDLVKESIFNLLNHSKKIDFDIFDSNILDLFSGCGSFGIECISRGAKKITFIENYIDAFKILEKNISSLNISNKAHIINQSCFDYFRTRSQPVEKFDLIFLDPPFREKNINVLLEDILKKDYLTKKGLIILHRHRKDDVLISKKLQIIEMRNYGISKIIFGR